MPTAEGLSGISETNYMPTAEGVVAAVQWMEASTITRVRSIASGKWMRQ